MSHFYFYDTIMDDLRIKGLQRMHDEQKVNSLVRVTSSDAEAATFQRDWISASKERDAYQKALQDIIKAHTVGEMIKIADRVLKENGKR